MMKQNIPNAVGGRTCYLEPEYAPVLHGVTAKPKSGTQVSAGSGQGIHPIPQPRARLQRKRRNHEQNHAARAEVNRRRSNNKNEPNWHGTGRHAGLS